MLSKTITSQNYKMTMNTIVGYTAIEVFNRLMDQCTQPEDVADQITSLLHTRSEQRTTGELLQEELINETIDESTLIQHGLYQFKEYLDLMLDIEAWKETNRVDRVENFISHFTKAINDNKSDVGTFKGNWYS